MLSRDDKSALQRMTRINSPIVKKIPKFRIRLEIDIILFTELSNHFSENYIILLSPPRPRLIIHRKLIDSLSGKSYLELLRATPRFSAPISIP